MVSGRMRVYLLCWLLAAVTLGIVGSAIYTDR